MTDLENLTEKVKSLEAKFYRLELALLVILIIVFTLFSIMFYQR